MSKSNTFEDELLKLIFQNANIPNIGDATGLRGSSTAGSLYISLHTADPGEAGTQATNEISYTGYARQAVARNATNFPVSGGTMSLGVNVDFPKMTGGTGGVVTHWAVGKEASGATVVLYKGTVSPNITVNTGVTPRIEGTPAGTPSTVTED
jgi:hypothetical protein